MVSEPQESVGVRLPPSGNVRHVHPEPESWWWTITRFLSVITPSGSLRSDDTERHCITVIPPRRVGSSVSMGVIFDVGKIAVNVLHDIACLNAACGARSTSDVEGGKRPKGR